MKSCIDISIRFSDVDMAGHVHNSKYLCYFELGRIDYLSRIAGKDWNWKKKGIILGRNEIDYLTPIYLTDKIYLDTKCDYVGNKSFVLSYIAYKRSEDKDIICSKGKSTIICINFDENTTLPVYSEWKDHLLNSIDAS